MKVSVIIPVYNVSAFVRRCTVSLMEQTLDDVEFIFVDDASPDDSINIVQDVIAAYPQRDCRIITHSENKGLPSARNTGLAEATGDYIYHCDSDDWTEPTLLEKMYEAAVKDNADIVYCDFFISFDKNERYMGNPRYGSAEEMLKRGFLGGMMKYNVWNKLVRRKLYSDHNILFPDGHPMGEDMTMISLCAVANGVAYVPEGLYHYVKLNANAYSNSVSEKKLNDIRFNADRAISFLEKQCPTLTERDIANFKLSIKLPYIISDDKAWYGIWKEWYPEANRFAMANKDLPIRTRLLQWMAAHNMWGCVRLYYKLIYKFIYGVIFK